MIRIVGVYKGGKKIGIDLVEEIYAAHFLNEYRIVYGAGWIIWTEKVKDINEIRILPT